MKLIETIGKEVKLNFNVIQTLEDHTHVKINSKIIVLKTEELPFIKGVIKAVFEDKIHVQINSKILLLNRNEVVEQLV